MTDPAIPSPNDPIAAGIGALIAARPSAAPFTQTGRYGDVFAGWRAQAAVLIVRVADEVRSARLPTSVGDSLRALVASEFDVDTSTDGRSAPIGTVTFSRSAHVAGGTVTRGTRFKRTGNTNLSPAIVETLHAVTEDVYVPNFGAPTSVALPCECTQAGTAGNVFADDGTFTNTVTPTFQWVDPIFDPTIPFTSVDIGGGSDITTNDDLRRAARSMAQGRYAPVVAALLAYALRGQGVRRVGVFEDATVGIARLLLADGSRSGSAVWAARVKQFLYDQKAVGFGCRIACTPMFPAWVAVQATIVLRDSNYLNYQTDISNAVRTKLASYFGNRDDFWSFKAQAVRAAIARADPRILTCTSATVVTPGGITLPGPVTLGPGDTIPDPAPWVPGTPLPTTFWTLANRGLMATYTGPS